MFSRFRFWFLNTVRRTRFERGVDDEIAAHVQLRADDLERSGTARADAERQARIEFGGVQAHKEDIRRAVGLGFLDGLTGDLRYVARSVRRHLALSASIVATLALTIGISTGVFTLLEAVALRPRIDRDRGSFFRVRVAYATDADRFPKFGPVTLPDYLAYRARAKSAAAMTAYARFGAALDASDGLNTRILAVTCDFFSVYVPQRPLLGRPLQQADCDHAEPVIVLSEPAWRQRYAADPAIVGRTVRVNNRPVTVVGVLPTYAGQAERGQAWVPYTMIAGLGLGVDLASHPEAPALAIAGLAAPRRSRADVAAEITLAAAQQDRLAPGRRSQPLVTDGSMIAEPGSRVRVTGAVAAIMAVLGFVVLIACTNVATLLLARAEVRRREVAIRMAIGASRSRLFRLLLAETTALAALAGIISIWFAYRVPAALIFMLSGQTFEFSVDPDWRVFAWLAFVTLFVGVAAGLSPARQALGLSVVESLKSGGGGAARDRAPVYRRLIASQVALSFVLLCGAVLFHRASRRMETVDVGHATRDVVSVQLFDRDPSNPHLASALRETVRPLLLAVPGVQRVVFATTLPSMMQRARTGVPADGPRVTASAVQVSGGFFEALGIRIASGRALGDEETPCTSGGCPVVVSRELARRAFGARDPLGAALHGDSGVVMQVVGVAADVRSGSGMDGTLPILYQPWEPQRGRYSAYARVVGNPSIATAAISAAMRDALPDISVAAQTVESLGAEDVQFFHQLASLIALLAAVAVGLAMIGLYGVVAFSAKRRTSEIGLRIALGATASDIYKVVARGYTPSILLGLVAGVIISAPGALVIVRLFDSADQFPILDHTSPLSFALAVAVMLTVSVLAVAGPARRAAKADPLTALRTD